MFLYCLCSSISVLTIDMVQYDRYAKIYSEEQANASTAKVHGVFCCDSVFGIP